MKKIVFFVVSMMALTKVTAQTQIIATNPELATVDGVIKNLYEVISGPAGQLRNWNKMRDLFRPEARLSALGTDRDGKPRFVTMAIEDYIRNSGPNFEQNGFFEREIGRVTEQYGDMVHVFSAYEARRAEKDTPYMRGINSIQLVKKDGRFWIVNILWNTETKENPIPAKYLGK
ncbi:MAG: hypothetical protein ACOYOO_01695 [Saprospiraceae bacterium]|jgi:hypothetical protein